MGGFVKLSVDNLDQLQFKAVLFTLNVGTFIARWLHGYLFPTEVGVDSSGQFTLCSSDGTYTHCPVCAVCPDVNVSSILQALNATLGGR